MPFRCACKEMRCARGGGAEATEHGGCPRGHRGCFGRGVQRVCRPSGRAGADVRGSAASIWPGSMRASRQTERAGNDCVLVAGLIHNAALFISTSQHGTGGTGFTTIASLVTCRSGGYIYYRLIAKQRDYVTYLRRNNRALSLCHCLESPALDSRHGPCSIAMHARAACTECTATARCGSCRNVHSKAHDRSSGQRASAITASTVTMPIAACTSVDLPRSRSGLNQFYHLVATTTPHLWCVHERLELASAH